MPLSRLRDRLAGHWREERRHPIPLSYLSPTMAARDTVLGYDTAPGFRYAVAYFGAVPLDRLGLLDPGFPVEIQDPIPAPAPTAALDSLCDARAAHIVRQAQSEDLPIVVLWSGGIDSTAATVALLRALEGDLERLSVVYSRDSVKEYRLFHRQLKDLGVHRRRVTTLHQAMAQPGLLVTGEHGDQIFGSILAATLEPRDYHRPWAKVLAEPMAERLGKKGRRLCLNYLEPITVAHPTSNPSAFEMLWWWNFSMKWQSVSERMIAGLPDDQRQATAARLYHFYRTEAFQSWSLNNRDRCIGTSWASYKQPLKDYILAWTKDRAYWRDKVKEPSLAKINKGAGGKAVAMDVEFRVLTQARRRRLRDRDEDGLSVNILIYGDE